MTFFIKTLIRLYQEAFPYRSRVARCKFCPSCSEYMLLAIERYGVWAGMARGTWRILRCNPFSKGGLDMP